MGTLIKYNKGDNINGLTYISELPFISGTQRKIKFKCKCGKEFVSRVADVRHSKIFSCGCHKIDVLYKRNFKHGDSFRKKEHYLHQLWANIKDRCYNEKTPGYKNYGGRGILVYKKWIESYVRFKYYILLTIGERPSKKHSLDRINNDGNYEPKNLRWATRSIQNHNQRPRKLTDNQIIGIKHLIKLKYRNIDIAKLHDVSASLICDIKKGRCHKTPTL